ncbi:nonribosomal peptide synthetase [Trichophyton tonsurans CBS 112818]|uniref:Nonribosomal peptide synthetase n=1 Tax=Trichophyton tonsurans (strain CBS 112818) TaxID=647933 RepID=F2S0G1_TRIT1|nr:nonribosomal peptide synthetase [Trichophyton tonsurans CBS 112818]
MPSTCAQCSLVPNIVPLIGEVKSPSQGSEFDSTSGDVVEIIKQVFQPPRRQDTCIDHMIIRRCQKQPDAPAICAWDGDLSYQQLHDASELLGSYLFQLGATPTTFIPIYLEKSKWTAVAMLGVLKAGAAFVLLDPSHPLHRLRQICSDVEATMVVGLSRDKNMADSLGGAKFVALDEEQTGRCQTPCHLPSQSFSSSPAYAVFTSGSTGRPKGVAIDHAAFTIAAHEFIQRTGLGVGSRVFQFASYAFDVSIADHLVTLTAGGCVCIPSEPDRINRLSETIHKFRANWADLTPSVARLLSPKEVPSLATLVLAGEAMRKQDITDWAPHVNLINHYGPAECAIGTSLSSPIEPNAEPGNIGYSMGCLSWIVDPEDHNRLVAFGDIGELVIEGHIMARGYLCGQPDDNSPFLSTPLWLKKLRSGCSSSAPLYKTGDLVRYSSDGSMQYLGRKDHLVKIHGQRIQPEEVEHYIQKFVRKNMRAIVQALPISNGDSALISFVCQDIADTQLSLQHPNDDFVSWSSYMKRRLADFLPAYMIPSFVLSVSQLPLTTGGKVNRQALMDLVSDLPVSRLAEYQQKIPEKVNRVDIFGEAERTLKKIWCDVLGSSPETTNRDDGFIQSGGNSIRAMQLVSAAHKLGLHLTVADIFNACTFSEVAACIKPVPELSFSKDSNEYLPFSLLGDAENQREFLQLATKECAVDKDEIEDIYPATRLQEGLMALSVQTPNAYVSQHVFRLATGVDPQRVREAWQETVRANAILRTRMIAVSTGAFQVVLQSNVEISTTQDLEQYLQDDKERPMALGKPLIRLCVSSSFVVLTLNHAIYDGVSLKLILDHFTKVHQGLSVSVPAFAPFIAYIQQQKNNHQFWQSQLINCSAPIFPALPSAGFVPRASAFLERRVTGIRQVGGHTTSNVIRLALALLISHYTNCEDIIFGVTVNGRGAPVANIDEVTGPTFSTIPMRFTVSPEQNILRALSDIQKKATDMIPFEQAGLQFIRRIGEDANTACQFQTHLVVQPQALDISQEVLVPQHGRCLDVGENAKFASYALLIVCTLDENCNAVDIAVNFDPRVITEIQVQRIVQQFGHILLQMQNPGVDMCLGQVQCASPEDLADLRRWNHSIPTSCDQCLHDMVLSKCASQPSAIAVSAWDGEFTYQELERLSGAFALRLRELNVTNDSMVPFCLDRSKWAVVSILAVLRAGGTCVLTDPSQPRARVQGIIRETGARLALVSPRHVNILEGLPCAALSISDATYEDLPKYEPEALPTVAPKDPAFIVFTSGSTGKPKGIIVEHRNLATCARDQYGPMGYTPNCRILHFASYAFDLSMYETVVTLIFGGCVCVPSEEQRLADLAGCMRQYRINWAVFTPSSLRLFRPEDVPDLKVFCIGGESLTQAHVDVWAHKVKFINSYGPAETCFCTAGVIDPEKWQPGDVGDMFGGLAWITVINNPNHLAPIGAVGELVVEGPAVARGYLNNEELTRASFIDAPPWLKNWRAGGKVDRLYRTGDLVRYGDNGIICFVGRRDTQVKLRGQRVELTEVEYHLQRCFSGAEEIVAEVIVPSSPPTSKAQASLVAFVFNGDDACNRQAATCLAVPTERFSMAASLALAKLRTTLPTYMVPTILLPLASIPLTGTGKINRRELREVAANLAREKINSYLPSAEKIHATVKRPPGNEVEQKLHSICAWVLNVDPNEIGVDDDFFRLGGDSISAMQVAAKAKAVGLSITVRDIITRTTIADIASSSIRTASMAVEDEDVAEIMAPFGLSPIQTLFFDTIRENHNYFNQSFSLRLSETVGVKNLDAALQAVVAHHSMLRARFRQESNGDWVQQIQANVSKAYTLQSHIVQSTADAIRVISDSQQSLDIANGPLLRADLMEMPSGHQYLFLVAHHLVMDLVSWRIIFADLEEALRTGGKLSATPSLPFPNWCRLQAEYGKQKLLPGDVFPFDLLPSVDGFWGDVENRNTWGDIETVSFTLDMKTTASLYDGIPCLDGLQATPLELYHTALLAAFVRTFTSRPAPNIHCEGHGREVWDSSLDLSRTVGWFTTIWPCPVPCNNTFDLFTILKDVHSAHARMPSHGWGYFTSRYTNIEGREKFQPTTIPEIVLNYSGLYQQLEREGALLQQTDEFDGTTLDIIKSARRFGLIEISVGVRNGCIEFDFSYNRHMDRQEDIKCWAELCQELLVEMAEWHY